MSSSAQRASGEWFHTINHEYMANLPKSMSRKSLAPYTARIPHFSVGRRRHGRGRRSGRSVFPNIQSGVRGVNLPRGIDMISKVRRRTKTYFSGFLLRCTHVHIEDRGNGGRPCRAQKSKDNIPLTCSPCHALAPFDCIVDCSSGSSTCLIEETAWL